MTQTSITNMHPSTWKSRLLLMKKKCDAKRDESTSKKKKIFFKILLSIKDFEDKCLGTTHKIKSVTFTILPWIYTCFKCIQIFCVLQQILFSFLVPFSCFIISILMTLFFHYFNFYGKIALWLISYAMKMFAAKNTCIKDL